MGFIDYSGTKEDRYSDVLDFAKSQQEEEARRLEDEFVGKKVKELIGDSRYASMDIGELIKHVIVKYRILLQTKDSIIAAGVDDSPIDPKVLWNDLCIALIAKRLEGMNLPLDKRNTYYNTFKNKVFKLSDATSAEVYYSQIEDSPSYQRYFSDCFDLVQEKQFWKWFGRAGADNKKNIETFVNNYEQLSVLIGYYLFQGIRPADHNWLQRLEIEHKALERLKSEYAQGRFKEPNFAKLQNPLYLPVKPEKAVEETKPEQTESEQSEPSEIEQIKQFEEPAEQREKQIKEPQRPRRPQLEKEKFEELLKQQKLLSYVEACRLLRKCELPEEMDELYQSLIIRMPILQESMDKFEEVYQPDMYQFYEYYIPEALQLTATYIEYLDVGIGEKILQETENEILDAAKKLLIAVNDKIDEIYKFASIEIKARSKALESLMSQDGYIDQKFNIKNDGGNQ